LQDDHTHPTLSREGKWEKTERKESRGKVKGGKRNWNGRRREGDGKDRE